MKFNKQLVLGDFLLFATLVDILFLKAFICSTHFKTEKLLLYAVITTGVQLAVRSAQENGNSIVSETSIQTARGMVLPFQPLSLAFNHVNYYVDMPAVSAIHPRLEL